MSSLIPLLQAQKLSRHFGGLIAVNEVEFEVQTGEIVGLIGPNGAGKTTLFNMLCGSMAPTHGKIIFNGVDCTSLSAHDMAQRGMARTFPITSLFPHLRVGGPPFNAKHDTSKKRLKWPCKHPKF